MGEEATIRTLSAHRDVTIGIVRSHAGRLVDTPGDNLLAEFPSVVKAVQLNAAQARSAELGERSPLRVAGPRVYGPFALASGVPVDAVRSLRLRKSC
jgi:class 3 adenylate cyclase